MSLNTFVTHPSVRIKGTENNYNPVQCLDPECFNKSPHMHCPFCVISESFHDPVILKAHYRVKHVDKGLEFAGLKILRCCDHCDIVGAIKGEKRFRGAHWHCYRCKNGFNRRDEAMKHYKTHFRNPQTTFQIQITQEVNHVFQEYNEANQIIQVENPNGEDFVSVQSIHPVLTEAVMTTSGAETSLVTLNNPNAGLSNGTKSLENNDTTVSVAANETVNSGETIMIIEEHLDGSHADMGTITFTSPTTTDRLQYNAVMEEKNHLEKKIEELQQRNEQLEIEKSQVEQNLQNEIESLKLQVAMQAHAIQNYQKQENELLNQLRVPLDSKIQDVLGLLQTQHQELLHQQLAQVRRTYLQQLEKNEDNFPMDVGNENILIEINDNGVAHSVTNGELKSSDNTSTEGTASSVPETCQIVTSITDSAGKDSIVCIRCVLDDGSEIPTTSVDELKQISDTITDEKEEDGLPEAKKLKLSS